MVDRATMWGFLRAPCGYMYSIGWMSFGFCLNCLSKVAILEWLEKLSVSIILFSFIDINIFNSKQAFPLPLCVFLAESSIFYCSLE